MKTQKEEVRYMKKSFKKLIAFLLVFMLIFLLTVYNNALNTSALEQEVDGVKYSTILSNRSNISKNGIIVTCKASLEARYSTNLKIVMTLQKNTSSGYTDVKTWTTTGNGTYLDAEESRAINILYTYRLKVTFTAGNESVTTYSYY